MTTPISAPLRASFNPLIRPYLVLTGGMVMIMSIVGIPLAVIWFLGVGQWWARHYFDKLECELSASALRFRKGILVQVEKTIPLENIQDVTFIEGPLLRRFDLSTLRFETAGQGGGKGNDMRLTGIIDAAEFRNKILAARDALKENRRAPHAVAGGDAAAAALAGIAGKMDEIIALLKARKNP